MHGRAQSPPQSVGGTRRLSSSADPLFFSSTPFFSNPPASTSSQNSFHWSLMCFAQSFSTFCIVLCLQMFLWAWTCPLIFRWTILLSFGIHFHRKYMQSFFFEGVFQLMQLQFLVPVELCFEAVERLQFSVFALCALSCLHSHQEWNIQPLWKVIVNKPQIQNLKKPKTPKTQTLNPKPKPSRPFRPKPQRPQNPKRLNPRLSTNLRRWRKVFHQKKRWPPKIGCWVSEGKRHIPKTTLKSSMI